MGVVEATFEGAVLALGVFEDAREPALVYSGLEVRSEAVEAEPAEARASSVKREGRPGPCVHWWTPGEVFVIA